MTSNSLSEQVYESILQMLVQGDFRPGDRLPSENELSERFGVSRNTVRAAINKLNVLGFTETKHGGGTYVQKIGGDVYLNFFIPAILLDAHDLIDVMEFRKGIEVQAVKLAAERATAEDVRELKVLYKKSEKSIAKMEDYAFHNTNFHARIAKASHNSMFEKMMDIIRSIIMTKMQDFLSHQGEDIDSNFYHHTLLQCVINHKPDEAAIIMDKHLTLVIERVKKYSQNGAAERPAIES